MRILPAESQEPQEQRHMQVAAPQNPTVAPIARLHVVVQQSPTRRDLQKPAGVKLTEGPQQGQVDNGEGAIVIAALVFIEQPGNDSVLGHHIRLRWPDFSQKSHQSRKRGILLQVVVLIVEIQEVVV